MLVHNIYLLLHCKQTSPYDIAAFDKMHRKYLI